MREFAKAGTSAAIVVTLAFAAMSASAAPAWQECATCHPKEVDEYRLSGMGRSISKLANDHPLGSYGHGFSGTTFRTSTSDAGLVQEIERGGLSAEYAIDYVIGSGNAAFGYLVRVGDALFQSPIAYYTERGQWGMAPGMEQEANPDFNRPATSECLWCHAGRPAHTPNTVNRYGDPALPEEAISCDRCHGSLEPHLADPSKATIFNPAGASPRQRDSVCEQCHLGGTIRILHPGRTFGSFRPGAVLEDFWTVFVGVPRTEGGQDRFQVVSHVEQLSLSRCAVESGDALWCGTCHNPHENPTEPKAYFSARCVQCHGEGLPQDHETHSGDCISCHMPRRQSHDSGHSAFTDHRISLHPLPAVDPDPPDELRPWRPSPRNLRLRNLGIANILYGQQRGSQELLQRGLGQLRSVSASFKNDPAALDAFGTAMVLAGSPRSGLRKLREAIAAGPVGALQFNSLAAAWWALGDANQAEAALHEAILREPTLESSYRMLAKVHDDLGQNSKATATWRKFLEKRPRVLQARQAVRDADLP
ncbi:MAG: hypothetical protein OXJ37_19495 [Bryobacterales bacterium]|nr:hypothetical protein [Bryobacterales bacterium]